MPNIKSQPTPNYTNEMVSSMVSTYTANPTKDTVAALSTKLGKSTRSIIAKLSREGVYIPVPRTTKTGAPVVRKETLVDEIGSLVNGSMPSLVKASKDDLEKLLTNIKTLLEA